MRRRAYVLLMVGSAGCSPAHEPATPTAMGSTDAPALSVSAVRPVSRSRAVSPDGVECRIHGPRARLTLLVTDGPRSFPVAFEGAPISLIPGEHDQASAHVLGELELDGHAEGLEYYPVKPIEAAGGIVELGPISTLRDTSPRGSALVARTVDIGASSFSISELSVPCSSISFVGSGDPSEPSHRAIQAPSLRAPACTGPCAFYSTPDTLDFFFGPGSGERIRLTGSTVVAEIERKPGWIRVSSIDYVHIDGAQLLGWVDASRLTKLQGGVGFTGGRSFLSPPAAGSPGVVKRSGKGIYQGEAHIDSGTVAFADATGGQPWATVRDGSAGFEVVITQGQERAEVVRAPSIPLLTHAWVAAKAVHTLATLHKP